MTTRSWLLRIAASVSLLLLPACTYNTDPGCGDCVREIAAVRKEIRGVEGVRRVKDIDTYPASPTNGATVDVWVIIDPDVAETVPDELLEIIWRSRLRPVEVVDLDLVTTTGDLVETRHYDLREGTDDSLTYVERWGERPVR